MTACQHLKTRVVYEQRPPSEGRKLQAAGRKCDGCGQLLQPGEWGNPAKASRSEVKGGKTE